jgi:hypothetical protein
MHNRFSLLIVLLISACFPVFSQNGNYVDPAAFGYYNDALRFSRTTFGGSARYLGISGAQTALGGDIGSLAGNPAGLGFYRRSEFSISPSLGFASANAVYSTDASAVRDNKGNFNFQNIGVVFSRAKDGITPGAWRGGSWGIALTKTNNFNNRYSYSGTNSENSIVDYFYNQTSGFSPQDLGTGSLPVDAELAFNTYLLDTIDNQFVDRPIPYFYENGTPRPEYQRPTSIRQSGTVETRGAQSQIDIAYGGNFADRLYLGAALGINTIRYNESRTFMEESLDAASSLNSIALTDELSTTGTGINLRAGAIFRATDWIRIGGSIQTPTYYAINESYSTSLTANYNNFSYSDSITLTNQTVSSDPGAYAYRLATPFKATAGVALFAGKFGFWSTDVEYVSYNNAKISSDENNMSADNRTISNLYRPTLNIRSGAEFRTGIFRLRAGGGYYGDPYRSGVDNINREIIFISGGAGIRLPDYYFDLAVVNSKTRSGFAPYTLDNGANPSASIRNGFTNITFTFGAFF